MTPWYFAISFFYTCVFFSVHHLGPRPNFRATEHINYARCTYGFSILTFPLNLNSMINVSINMKIIYFKSSYLLNILIYNYSFVRIESNRLRLCLEKYYLFVIKKNNLNCLCRIQSIVYISQNYLLTTLFVHERENMVEIYRNNCTHSIFILSFFYFFFCRWHRVFRRLCDKVQWPVNVQSGFVYALGVSPDNI